MSEQPTKPTLEHIMGPVIEAIVAGELVLPEMSDSPVLQGAGIEDEAATGFGIVSDPETGLRALLPSYQVFRGTAEYEEEFTAFMDALREDDGDGLSVTDIGELLLEEIVHDFLHLAHAANESGGDDGLDEFIEQGLVPRAGATWALLDAYSLVVRDKLPAAGDAPLELAADLLGDIDPYGNDGRDLAVLLWFLLETEMHPASEHASAEVQAARNRKPVSKKAKKHAERPRKR
jgi:hypothetical protein